MTLIGEAETMRDLASADTVREEATSKVDADRELEPVRWQTESLAKRAGEVPRRQAGNCGNLLQTNAFDRVRGNVVARPQQRR
jgi:hypothetical protein